MLSYKNYTINFNGIDFLVLDTNNLSFSNAFVGIKSKTTKVKCAKGGEKIETLNKDGKVESVTIAEKGDAIFCNSETDIYIPRNNDGTAWKFEEITSCGYDIVGKGEDYIIIKSNNKALLLVGVIDNPTCIENAWGEGQHQFLYKGATLKKDLTSGKVTGIDKHAFETTWEILSKSEDLIK